VIWNGVATEAGPRFLKNRRPSPDNAWHAEPAGLGSERHDAEGNPSAVVGVVGVIGIVA